MTTVQVEALKALAEEHAAKIAVLRSELESEERLLALLRSKTAVAGPDAGHKPLPAKAESPASLVTDSIPARIVSLFRELNNKAMNAAEIEAELIGRGSASGAAGGLRPSIVSAMHRRKDLFERVGSGVFRLRDWPTAP